VVGLRRPSTVSAGSGQVPAALVRTPASWQARSSVELPGEEVFYSHVHLHSGPAPVRRFLPELIGLICNRTIHPGNVFDLELPLEQAAEGYRATDERRAINALLRP